MEEMIMLGLWLVCDASKFECARITLLGVLLIRLCVYLLSL